MHIPYLFSHDNAGVFCLLCSEGANRTTFVVLTR